VDPADLQASEAEKERGAEREAGAAGVEDSDDEDGDYFDDDPLFAVLMANTAVAPAAITMRRKQSQSGPVRSTAGTC
jgi:hypothetical protein